MKIKKMAFGNAEKSFIEERFNDGVNVIFSDENNRGKTLVIQGLMYSIGNEPIFPTSFDYKDHYFYSKIEVGSKEFEFLRKNNTFVLKQDDSIQLFNSQRDFRYYVDNNIFQLPRIIKDGRRRMVDFNIFYELFFIGQDKRNSSNLITKGQFNKGDFTSMVLSLGGISGRPESEKSAEEINNKIKLLKSKLVSTKKKINIIKSNPQIASIVSKSYDSENIQSKIKAISEINKNISAIKRSRQREINRIEKLKVLVSELRSLNKGLSEGTIQCGDCGSKNIIYTNDELKFEISNTNVRNNIFNSISANIIQKEEIINELNDDLSYEQSCLQEELSDTPPNFQEIVVYQDMISDDRDLDREADNISQEMTKLKNELLSLKDSSDKIKEEQKDLLEKIITEMTKIYKELDSNGNLTFESIFTKNDATYSGSEEQEYYFSRLVSLNNILKHPFPIIVDSFRDGEISTGKEEKMLEKYISLKKQVIITSTLKKEESNKDKYINNTQLNSLDYSMHKDREILQSSFNVEFMKIVDSFGGIVLE